MSLEKTTKPKVLGFKATESFHKEVHEFCNERNWHLSKFLEQAVIESMIKVLKRESK